MPPASDTAATSWWYDTPPMPASITGCSMSRSSVRRVRMGSTVATGLSRRASRAGRAADAAVGPRAGAGEEAAVPPARREHDGAGLVLEQPTSEVAPRPVVQSGEPHRARARRAVAEQTRPATTDIRWSANRWRRTSSLVALAHQTGPERAAGDDRLRRQHAGDQRLRDPLARQGVGGAGRVADEEDSAAG